MSTVDSSLKTIDRFVELTFNETCKTHKKSLVYTNQLFLINDFTQNITRFQHPNSVMKMGSKIRWSTIPKSSRYRSMWGECVCHFASRSLDSRNICLCRRLEHVRLINKFESRVRARALKSYFLIKPRDLGRSTPGIHRSTSIPAALPRADSPRSTRSAPWTQPRGLYSGAASPRSVRSAGHRSILQNQASRLNRRSGSVESQSSVDSRACKRSEYLKNFLIVAILFELHVNIPITCQKTAEFIK